MPTSDQDPVTSGGSTVEMPQTLRRSVGLFATIRARLPAPPFAIADVHAELVDGEYELIEYHLRLFTSDAYSRECDKITPARVLREAVEAEYADRADPGNPYRLATPRQGRVPRERLLMVLETYERDGIHALIDPKPAGLGMSERNARRLIARARNLSR